MKTPESMTDYLKLTDAQKMELAGLPSVPSDALLADLVIVEELARLAPELNPSNYDHEDVCRLNAAMGELYEVVRKYRPEANNSITGGQGYAPPACSVAEMVALQAEKPCSTCRGKGRVMHWPQARGGWMEELCQRCGGTGTVGTPNTTDQARGSRAKVNA